MVSRKVKSSSCDNSVKFALTDCELIIVKTMSLIRMKRTFREGKKRRTWPNSCWVLETGCQIISTLQTPELSLSKMFAVSKTSGGR